MLSWQLGSLDDKLEKCINSISANSVILTDITTVCTKISPDAGFMTHILDP